MILNYRKRDFTPAEPGPSNISENDQTNNIPRVFTASPVDDSKSSFSFFKIIQKNLFKSPPPQHDTDNSSRTKSQKNNKSLELVKSNSIGSLASVITTHSFSFVKPDWVESGLLHEKTNIRHKTREISVKKIDKKNNTFRKNTLSRLGVKLGLKSKYNLQSCESISNLGLSTLPQPKKSQISQKSINNQLENIENSSNSIQNVHNSTNFKSNTSTLSKKRKAPLPPKRPESVAGPSGAQNLSFLKNSHENRLNSSFLSKNSLIFDKNEREKRSLSESCDYSDFNTEQMRFRCHVRGKRKAPVPPNPFGDPEENEPQKITFKNTQIDNSSQKLAENTIVNSFKTIEKLEINDAEQSHSATKTENLLDYEKNDIDLQMEPINNYSSPSSSNKDENSKDLLNFTKDLKKEKEFSKKDAESNGKITPRPWYKRTNSKNQAKKSPIKPISNLPNLSELTREADKIIEEKNRKSAEAAYNATAKELINMFNNNFPSTSSSLIDTNPKNNQSFKNEDGKYDLGTFNSEKSDNSLKLGPISPTAPVLTLGHTEERKKLAIVQPQKSENYSNYSTTSASSINLTQNLNSGLLANRNEVRRSEASDWSCPKCTLINREWRNMCEACFYHRENENVVNLNNITENNITQSNLGQNLDIQNPQVNKTKVQSPQVLKNSDDFIEVRNQAEKLPVCENFLAQLPEKEKLGEKELGVKLEEKSDSLEELNLEKLREARVNFFSNKKTANYKQDKKLLENEENSLEFYKNLEKELTEWENLEIVSESRKKSINRKFNPVLGPITENIYSDEETNTFMQNVQVQIQELGNFYELVGREDTEPNKMNKNVKENLRETAQNAAKLLKKLDLAISTGNSKEASKLAYELAILKSKIPKGAKKELTTFTINVYVEDRLMQQGPFFVQVSDSMSVRELKLKIESDWGIPANFQKWILGKQMVEDENKLISNYELKENSLGFLYLVTPDFENSQLNSKEIEKETLNETHSKSSQNTSNINQKIAIINCDDDQPGPSSKFYPQNKKLANINQSLEDVNKNKIETEAAKNLKKITHKIISIENNVPNSNSKHNDIEKADFRHKNEDQKLAVASVSIVKSNSPPKIETVSKLNIILDKKINETQKIKINNKSAADDEEKIINTIENSANTKSIDPNFVELKKELNILSVKPFINNPKTINGENDKKSNEIKTFEKKFETPKTDPKFQDFQNLTDLPIKYNIVNSKIEQCSSKNISNNLPSTSKVLQENNDKICQNNENFILSQHKKQLTKTESFPPIILTKEDVSPKTRRFSRSGSLSKHIEKFEAFTGGKTTENKNGSRKNSIESNIEENTQKSENIAEGVSHSKINNNLESYEEMVKMLEKDDLVYSKTETDCPVCLNLIPEGGAIVLRDCLHSFCKECLVGAIEFSEEAQVKCPYSDRSYSCDSFIQDREIRALVPKKTFDKLLAKSVKLAECQMSNSFHCKTADCVGWCIYEDTVNVFKCPVCNKSNCLNCQAIHENQDCQQYQRYLAINSETDEDAKSSRLMLEKMIEKGEALDCPACHVVLLKKWGCDWVRCSYCKTEICWVTKGHRWGPNGKGDTSGGCKCGVNGIKCHPKCTYCH